MTRNATLSSINCTSCGAGLDVLGGGRVVVQICPYCGAELDAQDNYKTLRQFKDLDRPASPLAIGERGVLFGVEFTTIGIVQHTERWGGRFYRWVDHQLYSPTHGYAWLTSERGHLVFSRRYRGSDWISEQRVETSDSRPSIYSGGETFRYYETTTSTITYVEGEFTWHPKLGERTVTVSAMSNSAMLGFSQTGDERETYRSVYVSKLEAETAFGRPLDLRPFRTHSLEPFVAGRNYNFLLRTSFVFSVLCLVLALMFSTRPGHPVLTSHAIKYSELPTEIAFPLEANSRIAQVTLRGDLQNSWAFFDIQMTDPSGQPVFQAGRTLELYSGRDSDGYWREGSGTASLRFRPEGTGTYTLALSVPEQGLWGRAGTGQASDRAFSRITVDVRSDLSSGRWLYALGGVFGLLFLYQFGRKWIHRRARWAGSDWVDED